ncbi:molybdopterin-dependent oxidoreductase [Paramaledivibacter caminithermalis]|jgi:formate dehydrogenase major subunit|uniref:Formate dehydrogenase major subunit n=1 Tax=Paramaledivibacter caminithermalis (strain DSM 15212 / CIP 107654 / DViRD3) TaxID=1121301 RepID=A0A1M6SQY7_PARC5|nr:molybdopterin-dependent oxidoreductase [Paramaledivibacter caminithermalis]SHK47047.1 formate dehydrogenase major subunit [Paramaledivibacter caminithermalis DSM 15212]
MSEIRLNINGREVLGYKGQTILEVARSNNIEIPTLCYDEKMEIYGSCGLCVVEVEGVPKLLRACATEIREGMVVQTNTDRVRESRKTALELLLSDHVGDCRPPCVLACPAGTDCQGYVGLIANGEYKEALKLIKEQLPLPASIGRVCPHPCEDACRRQLADEPISIAWLKSFVADIDLKDEEVFMPEIKPPTGKRVAVIGGGPGGLTAAYYLAKEGHKVVIFDAMPEMGGMLRYGIPQYRLPKEVLNKEIRIIEKMGVKMVNNLRVGKDVEFSHIRKTFSAVYVTIGAWESGSLRCPGNDLEGVIGGINFLTKFAVNEPIRTGDRIAVVGGGNTAMDACRTAIRLGAKEVYLLYRRTKEEMPADDVEIKEAEEEGVTFKYLVNPIEIIGNNGKVHKVRLQKMKQGPADASGRRSPIPIEGEEEVIEVDSVICSIGQKVNATGFEELELTEKGTIYADENTYQTNLEGVFAGGDATNKGASIAIESVGEAKRAAEVICKYLEGEIIPYKKPYYVKRHDLTEEDFDYVEKANRPPMPHLAPEIRKSNFEEVVCGYSEEAAKKDAMRCLECGCHDFFECQLIKYANEYDVKPERITGELHKRKSDDGHPFIERNSDKCILCGLCVRVCDEVMGVAALGLVDRGFDTIVKPALDKPLKETDCISCGQCISICPTGALGERLSIKKSVPVKAKETPTICSHCSVGCNINLNTKGNMLMRALPNKASKVDDGLLCAKGRFGFDIALKNTRLTKPLVRKEGKLEEVSWEEAALYTAKKAKSLTLLYGSSSLAVAVSDKYTNEEIYLVSKFAKDVLKTDNIVSFNSLQHGIKDVLGYDASTNTFEEILSTETILLIGSDIMNDHTIVGLKIKKAVENGASLITINPSDTKADEWAYRKIRPENNVNFLKEIAKALIDNGFMPSAERAVGFEELKSSLEEINVSENAKEIADIYGNSNKAMIIFDQSSVTADAAKMIANVAVISGHIGKARSGIIQLKANNNSQGLVDMGISRDSKEIVKGIQENTIKGLLVFGEDIPDVDLSNLDFLMVRDIHLTETAKKADVVLPAVSFAESRGTYTSSERRIQRINQAIPPLTNVENWQIIIKLANALSTTMEYNSPEDILDEISMNIPEYFRVNKEIDQYVFWPVNKNPILYSNGSGFNFPDKKAKLQVVEDGKLFEKRVNTSNLNNSFIQKLKDEGLI